MLNYELKIINTKDLKIRKIVKDKRSKIWGVIKLLDEVWDIKEPSAEKVKTIVRDYFGDILKGKTTREVNEIVIGIVEYLKDVTGLKLKEWQKAEQGLIEEGILKKGGVMNIREIIKEKGRWEGMRKGRQEGMRKGRQEGMQEGMQKGMQEGMQKGMQEGMQKGMQEGMQKGMQEGMQKGQKQIILNMLKKKADISFISEMTGLPAKDIKKLKNGA